MKKIFWTFIMSVMSAQAGASAHYGCSFVRRQGSALWQGSETYADYDTQLGANLNHTVHVTTLGPSPAVASVCLGLQSIGDQPQFFITWSVGQKITLGHNVGCAVSGAAVETTTTFQSDVRDESHASETRVFELPGGQKMQVVAIVGTKKNPGPDSTCQDILLKEKGGSLAPERTTVSRAGLTKIQIRN